MAGTPAAEVSVTQDLVRALIADQHPSYAHLWVRFVGEGWDNFTFRLGDDLAVRLPRREEALASLASEQGWLARLPLLPVPIPIPIATGGPGHGFPWPWSIIPWITGESVDLAPLNADQGPALAAFLKALHQPAAHDAPFNPWRGNPLETRRQGIGERLVRMRVSTDLVTPAIERAWSEALAVPVSGLRLWMHGDLHAQNVLSHEGRLVGVIDWGDLGYGDPSPDLAAVWGVLAHASARAEALAAYAPDDGLLARARGWAITFGATLYENGKINDPRHAAIGEATLRRLAADL
jgi:aminoglycoside phosphotransferase (APT) family kinase protein